MNEIPQAPKMNNPVMVDRPISYLQDELISKVGWLDHAFGRAQRLVTLRDQKEYYYPGVYIGNNEYLNVLPGQGIGNRTFFIVDDPQEVQFLPRSYSIIKCPISLVLWCDLSTIFQGTNERNTEEIKRQMMRVLSDAVMPSGSKIEVLKLYEQANNIFKEYSLKEIDTQFLMQPYAGLRVDGVLTYREDCND